MAITLGTFTKSDAGFVGTLRTLNAAAALAIVPVDKTSDNGPDYRVYAGQRRYEIGAGWSQVAKSSGETYVNLKIAAPDYAKRSVMRSDEAWTEGLRGLRAVRAPHNPGPWSRGAAPGATPQRPVQRDQTSA